MSARSDFQFLLIYLACVSAVLKPSSEFFRPTSSRQMRSDVQSAESHSEKRRKLTMYICPIYNVDGADEEMKEKWEHLRVNKNTKKILWLILLS